MIFVQKINRPRWGCDSGAKAPCGYKDKHLVTDHWCVWIILTTWGFFPLVFLEIRGQSGWFSSGTQRGYQILLGFFNRFGGPYRSFQNILKPWLGSKIEINTSAILPIFSLLRIHQNLLLALVYETVKFDDIHLKSKFHIFFFF